MNNADALKLLDDCATELAQVKIIIDGAGIGNGVVPHLTKFAVIRACGTIEQSFKTIIADNCSIGARPQIKRFLELRVRESSMNPSYDNICSLTNAFDDNWRRAFKGLLQADPDRTALKDSLQSLVDARNEFAHGGNPTATIGDVLTYFTNSRRVIEILDLVVV